MNNEPSSGFNRRSTAEEVTAGLDLSGKTAVITGVNSGLGFESMRVLALRGAQVIGLARTLPKAEKACAALQENAGAATPLACELSDFDSVAQAAERIRAMERPVDILLCNAGIMAPRRLQQRYGLELQFLTNHLGHFLLIRHLLSAIKAAPAGRIVLTSSAGHAHAPEGGIDFDNLSGERGYDAWKAYGQSKLANILCAKELARRLSGTAVTANAIHPGVIRTRLARSAGGPMLIFIGLFAQFFERTIPQGAATQIYAAAHPDCAPLNGEYLADCRLSRPSRHAQNPELARRLWTESERLLEKHLPK